MLTRLPSYIFANMRHHISYHFDLQLDYILIIIYWNDSIQVVFIEGSGGAQTFFTYSFNEIDKRVSMWQTFWFTQWLNYIKCNCSNLWAFVCLYHFVYYAVYLVSNWSVNCFVHQDGFKYFECLFSLLNYHYLKLLWNSLLFRRLIDFIILKVSLMIFIMFRLTIN